MLGTDCFAGSTQQHWPFPSSHVDLGYAYLFTHPGARLHSFLPSLLVPHHTSSPGVLPGTLHI